MALSSPTQLPYPDKFHKAKGVVKALHKEGTELSEETQLVLYALDRQVVDGPCREPKPSAWNARERALWQAWDHLGQMSREEAMRLYVKQLEIDVPKWWTSVPADEGDRGPIANGGGASASARRASCAFLPVEPSNADYKTMPKPRYEHGSLCVGPQMFVVGGRCGGRYLNDCWSFDLRSRLWTEKKWRRVDQSNMTVLPALAAANYLHLSGFKCVVVGGHTKPDDRTIDMKVYKVDLSTMEVEKCDAFGDNIPTARGGHSSALVRSQVFVFGGEETATKKLMNDLYVYDLHSSTWTLAQTKGAAPCARSAHSMAVVQDKFVVLFGGGSVSRCFNDLHVLDTTTMEWFQPEVSCVGPLSAHQSAEDFEEFDLLPEPRAGHCSVLLGDFWVVCGGGNNLCACTDTFALDVSSLGTQGRCAWIPLGEMADNEDDSVSLSCEGASLVESDATGRKAVAFGGYDGKYLDRVCALTLTEVQTSPAAPAAGGGGGGGVPAGKEAASRSGGAAASVSGASANGNVKAAREAVPIDSATAAAPASTEVARLESELAAVKEKLKREAKKTMRLEVENAELKLKLSKWEEDTGRGADPLPGSTGNGEETEQQSESGGGIWGFISGQS